MIVVEGWPRAGSLGRKGFSGTVRFSKDAMRPIAALAIVVLLAVAGLAGYAVGFRTAPANTTTVTSTSTSVTTSTSYSLSISTTSSATVLLAQGATFEVQSSGDCQAGYISVPFNVTAVGATLAGRINASYPGVNIYVATAQQAQTILQGHPAAWVSWTNLSVSTGFVSGFEPGSYVLWIEGADMGCGAPVVTPLEQMTTVTIPEAVTLTPGMGPFIGGPFP